MCTREPEPMPEPGRLLAHSEAAAGTWRAGWPHEPRRVATWQFLPPPLPAVTITAVSKSNNFAGCWRNGSSVDSMEHSLSPALLSSGIATCSLGSQWEIEKRTAKYSSPAFCRVSPDTRSTLSPIFSLLHIGYCPLRAHHNTYSQTAPIGTRDTNASMSCMAHMFSSIHLCEWIPSLSLPGVSLAHCPPATCISRPAIIVGMGSSVSSVARSVLAINLINLFPTTAAQTDRSGKNVVTSK